MPWAHAGCGAVACFASTPAAREQQKDDCHPTSINPSQPVLLTFHLKEEE